MPFGPEELALIEAIHADPNSNAPRLAYADWLVENRENEHAEFIRLQCQPPYFSVSNRDLGTQHQSYHLDQFFTSPADVARRDRMREVLPALYRTDRYASRRESEFFHERYRGLPLIYLGSKDNDNIGEGIPADMWPLCRVHLSIRTNRLSELLCHPIMARADFLTIYPPYPRVAVPNSELDFLIEPQCDEFWAENIPVLSASPVIDNLKELHLSDCHRFCHMSARARANLDLSEKLLETRVYVYYFS
jgi:uncharacterized protein (TIGR02996 family)